MFLRWQAKQLLLNIINIKGDFKMKKILSILIVSAIVLSSMFMMVGCSGKEEMPNEPESTAIVLGNHKYFPMLSLNIPSISSAIYDTCLSYGRVTAFIADGNAFLAGDYTINEPNVKVDNTKRKQIAKKNCDQIMSECSNAKAKTPEIDTLSAITQAAKSIQGSLGDKTLLIFDSGLSTTGLLNFAKQNLIDSDPDKIVEQLDEKHYIPDLNGFSVVWTGIGQTCGDQTPLTENYKYKLEKLYDAILSAGGATVTFNHEPIQGEEPEGVPECSIVPVVEDSLDIDGALPEVVKFDETKISFVSDEAEFVSELDAYDALKPVADILVNNTDMKVLIVGSTATDGTPEGCRKLSQMRADKVKDTLIELHVNPNQLSTYGAGQSSTPFRVVDLIDGELVETEAAKNRAVYIVNFDSSAAKAFTI